MFLNLVPAFTYQSHQKINFKTFPAFLVEEIYHLSSLTQLLHLFLVVGIKAMPNADLDILYPKLQECPALSHYFWSWMNIQVNNWWTFLLEKY